jgi:hypothetical protein
MNGVDAAADVQPVALEDLRRGLRIMQAAHPEYGTWIVLRHYGGDTWVIRRCRPGVSDMTLDVGELHYWRKVVEPWAG